jgi:aspartokinase
MLCAVLNIPQPPTSFSIYNNDNIYDIHINMVDMVVSSIDNSELKFHFSNDDINASCENCASVSKQLHNVLRELNSACSVIAVLQDDMKDINMSEIIKTKKSLQCSESSVCENNNG